MDLGQEEKFIINVADQFNKLIIRDAMEAKALFNKAIVPHMQAAVKTTKMLEDQYIGCWEENGFLLKCNCLLIEALKKNSIPLPNFSAIKDDVRKELKAQIADYASQSSR